MNSYLRMATLSVALLSATPSDAAVLTYTYQGQPLFYGSNSTVGWTGQFSIDTEFMPPGRTLSNAVFSFNWDANNFRQMLDGLSQVGISISYGPMINPGIGRGHFAIMFDVDHHISSWEGYNTFGYIDPYTMNGIDGWSTGFAQSIGPGTWTGGRAVAAVPLPATLPLFAIALGVIGLIGRRK
jgi:hypothetical protein